MCSRERTDDVLPTTEEPNLDATLPDAYHLARRGSSATVAPAHHWTTPQPAASDDASPCRPKRRRTWLPNVQPRRLPVLRRHRRDFASAPTSPRPPTSTR